MMKPLIWIFLSSLLVACSINDGPAKRPLSPVDIPAAQATYQAAAQQAQLIADRATSEAAELTRQSGEATAVAGAIATGTAQSMAQSQTATSESIAVQVTQYSLNAQATRDAISVSATGTAVVQLAQAEQHLIADEARRLALQREQERVAIEYQRTMNSLKPFLWAGLVLTILIVASSFAFVLYQRSRPIIISDTAGPRVLVPANTYQVLPVSRPQLALPDSTSVTANVPILLPPLTHGHVLIAGESGSGKSTAMLAILKRRQGVVVLDPHDDGATWTNANVIGGGRDFVAINTYMEQMKQLLSDRYQQRSQGQRRFEPVTVATDEMPAIVSAIGRGVDETWRIWLREGRKVNLFFVVSTQSTRVKTLGIKGEGDLLENFNYILLMGKLAVGNYPDLVSGMEWPAVICTTTGARPVTIPVDPTRLAEAGYGSPPTSMTPEAEPGNNFVDPNELTEGTRARIRHLAGLLSSRRAIERTVFGYTGGAAYQAVKDVLDAAATNGNSR